MKIAVVGAGAMGSLFGGLLAASGKDVTLVDVWREHVEAINAEGLRIGGHEEDRTVNVKATTDPSSVGPVDLIILFVKSYDTLEATRGALPMVSEDTVFLSLQNGLGNIEKYRRQLEEIGSSLERRPTAAPSSGRARYFTQEAGPRS